MVASEYSYPVSMFDFENENIQESFNAVESSIDIVPHEEIVGILNNSTNTGSLPHISKIYSKSWNWPCISPQTVTGALTSTMLDSSMSIYFT